MLWSDFLVGQRGGNLLGKCWAMGILAHHASHNLVDKNAAGKNLNKSSCFFLKKILDGISGGPVAIFQQARCGRTVFFFFFADPLIVPRQVGITDPRSHLKMLSEGRERKTKILSGRGSDPRLAVRQGRSLDKTILYIFLNNIVYHEIKTE